MYTVQSEGVLLIDLLQNTNTAVYCVYGDTLAISGERDSQYRSVCFFRYSEQD